MERKGHRRNVPSKIPPGESDLKESGPENRCIDYDDDRRNSTEEIYVDRDGPGKGSESGDPQPPEEETEHRAEGKDDGDKAKGRADSSFKTTSVSSPEFRVEEAEIEEDLVERVLRVVSGGPRDREPIELVRWDRARNRVLRRVRGGKPIRGRFVDHDDVDVRLVQSEEQVRDGRFHRDRRVLRVRVDPIEARRQLLDSNLEPGLVEFG